VSSSSSTADRPRTWRKPPAIASPIKRWTLIIGSILYLVWALTSLELNPGRMLEGLVRAKEFFAGVLAPDFVTRWTDIQMGFVESLTMTVVSTVVGVALAIPIGLGAAKNLAWRPIYLVCRSILAVSRAFHEVILAILFVAMFGFGPFAGLVTLVVSTIGFLGKLLAEDIESIDPTPVEAVTATGASWSQRVSWGVVPQVLPRFLGLCLYRLDINFRESAIIGIVGAGGIGATLNTAFDRYEFDSVAAILILIIALVFMAEYISGEIRKRVL
jgi:phosphonate transport system permease protein